MKTRLFLANLLFWLHAAIVFVWLGLFLVPTSVWHDRITYHFYLNVAIIGHQFIWGAMIMPWTKKYRMVCILTTPMQFLRGQKISDPKNYDHSFFKELAGKNGIHIPHRTSTLITFSAFILSLIQYFFFR